MIRRERLDGEDIKPGMPDMTRPERIAQTRPDYILVLPWNLRDEITRQLDYVRSWGGRLVFPIPALEVV